LCCTGRGVGRSGCRQESSCHGGRGKEVSEKDVLIQEKEKLYIELKNLLARQPGPEVAEQLSIYQQNLKEKTRQMKAMAAELNMYQAQVNEYKYEIERLTRELQDMKRKYYEQKRREQIQREAQQRLDPKNSIKHFPLPSIDVEVAFFMMMDTVSIFSRCLIELNVVISTSTTSSSTGYSIQVSLKSET
jgi:competence protein ComGC